MRDYTFIPRNFTLMDQLHFFFAQFFLLPTVLFRRYGHLHNLSKMKPNWLLSTFEYIIPIAHSPIALK